MDKFDKDLRSLQQVRNLIRISKQAQKEFSAYSQSEVDAVVKAIAERTYENAERLAIAAVEETGYGIVADKIIKNQFASKNVYEEIKDIKSIGIINEDNAKKIWEIATPLGVIAGLVPSTNPTSTAIYKAIIALKAGNSIIFSPHTAALNCILETVKVINEVCSEFNLPEGLVSCIDIPSMEATSSLMKHDDVSVILATGGGAMVKAAYSSGTPALGVGPGNVPSFIEKTADISLAVKRIIDGKTFDHGVICASEQAVVVQSCISEPVKKEFIKQGCYFVNHDEKKKFEAVIQKPSGAFNAAIVGKSPYVIGQMAGVEVPEDTRVIIAEETGVGPTYPFSREKLSPLLVYYEEETWQRACEKCIKILEYGGLGHSLSIHSEDLDIIREFALKKPVSRICVNTSSTHGAIGATTNLVPALTLGCGSVGGSSTSDNVSVKNLFDIRRVAFGVRELEDLRPAEVVRQEIETHGIDASDIDISEIVRAVIDELSKSKNRGRNKRHNN